MENKTKAFLSYARDDLATVVRIYEGLVARGIAVWFDQEHLGPGKWRPQITRAIAKSRFFIICLSEAALRKTGDAPGFIDTELDQAYNIALAQSNADFTIIPIRLEDCNRGDHRLTMYQQFDLFSDWGGALDRLAVMLGGRSLSAVVAAAPTAPSNVRSIAFTARRQRSSSRGTLSVPSTLGTKSKRSAAGPRYR
jgi:hypothetical protein